MGGIFRGGGPEGMLPPSNYFGGPAPPPPPRTPSSYAYGFHLHNATLPLAVH